ncbi:hypothetical protein niasHT_039324 [Heterodera trifolii]|uniref:Ribosomal protein S9 n=1 Tax=Heterodera trifolii TaxID=157864 RepID=A0ABD2J6R6_9BILA
MLCFLRSANGCSSVGLSSSVCSRFAFPRLCVLAPLSNESGLSECLPQSVESVSASVAAIRERERRERLLTISDAMKFYLKRKQDEMAILEKEKLLYAQGKRHLANIMGFDPDSISADQISQSIRYLFPSGLFDKKALPVMKPPEEVFPKIVKIDVDASGSPKHSLFFTAKPKFYTLLSDINKRTQKLVNAFDGHQTKVNEVEKMQTNELALLGEKPAEKGQINLMGTQWMTKDQLQQQMQEILSDDEYANFIIALEYISQLPNSAEEEDFIMSLRRGIGASEKNRLFRAKVPEVTVNENGRRECWRICRTRASAVKIVVRDGGTGNFTVNGQHYCTFRSLLARECLLAPMIVAGKLGKVDIEAHLLDGPGGLSVVPRAVRQGAALGLAALFPETMERLRLAGLLSTDPRTKERCKINQPGARAKWIWKKR